MLDGQYLENYMKNFFDKCHLLMAGDKFEQMWAKIGCDWIWECNSG